MECTRQEAYDLALLFWGTRNEEEQVVKNTRLTLRHVNLQLVLFRSASVECGAWTLVTSPRTPATLKQGLIYSAGHPGRYFHR